MSNFDVKIKVDRHQDDGSLKKVSEHYVVNSLSCTEAEARVTEFLNEDGVEEASIPTISRANYSDIFVSENEYDDIWFKAKVSFVSVDENAGREKKITQYMIIQSKDFDSAYDRLKEEFKGFTVPYEISSLSETKISDYIPYESQNRVNLGFKLGD